MPTAHGLQPAVDPSTHSAEADPAAPNLRQQPYWITALVAIPYSDVFFSGSWDGCIRAWKIGESKQTIEPLGIVGMAGDAVIEGNKIKTPFRGVVNCMAVYDKDTARDDGSCIIVAAIGQEMRLGEWIKVKGRNAGVMFTIDRKRLNGLVNGTTS